MITKPNILRSSLNNKQIFKNGVTIEKRTYIDCFFNGDVNITDECTFINCTFAPTATVKCCINTEDNPNYVIVYCNCTIGNKNNFENSIFHNCEFGKENHFYRCILNLDCVFLATGIFTLCELSDENNNINICKIKYLKQKNIENNIFYNIILTDDHHIYIKNSEYKITSLNNVPKDIIPYIRAVTSSDEDVVFEKLEDYFTNN